jgi:hypothetical protein
MSNWLLTLPRPLRQSWAERAREFEDWSMAELLAGRRLAQSTPEASPAPMSSAGASAEPTTTASQRPLDTPWPVAPAPQPGRA